MKTAPQHRFANLTLAQLFARLFSIPIILLILLLLAIFFIYTRPPEPEQLTVVISLFITLICIITAWFRGYWGGIAILISCYILWTAIHSIFIPVSPGDILFFILLESYLVTTGLLFVVTHWPRE